MRFGAFLRHREESDMTRQLKLIAAFATALAVTWAVPNGAHSAEEYPDRPITLVVAFSPGGATDILARAIQEDLRQALGQPIVVENRPGASGYIAWRSIQEADPDGYTILLAENALAINTAMRPDEPLDPREDFAAVARLATAPLATIVHSDLPIDTLDELIAYAQDDNDVSFSSSGVGSVSHMTFEALAVTIGLDAVHVPYRGGGEAAAAIAGGHVQAMNHSIGTAASLVEEGSVRALAVTDEQRAPQLPDVQTLQELGVETDVELRFWWGLFVPAGTPEPIIEKLESVASDLMAKPEMQERLPDIGYTPAFAPAEEMARVLGSEITHWRAFVEERGIEPEN
jgi:tripartite-type tricarboxylate transporter receptor subunit TctC